MEGEYYKIDSKTSLLFFEPFIDFSEYHCWYFTDSSFVILSLNSTSAKNFEYFSLLIILESDILKSIGLNLFYAALTLGITKGKKFEIRPNQIFSIYESCISCLFNDKQSRKGVIYQVETGEGKSLIIQLIAALLALTKNSVHIATSNIKLAKRDFVEIYNFYKKLGIKSAIMLHQNELIEDSDKKEVLQNIYN